MKSKLHAMEFIIIWLCCSIFFSAYFAIFSHRRSSIAEARPDDPRLPPTPPTIPIVPIYTVYQHTFDDGSVFLVEVWGDKCRLTGWDRPDLRGLRIMKLEPAWLKLIHRGKEAMPEDVRAIPTPLPYETPESREGSGMEG